LQRNALTKAYKKIFEDRLSSPGLTRRSKCADRATFLMQHLQDRFVQAQFGNQLLEPPGLFLKLPGLPHLIRLHARVMLLSAAERLFRDSHLPDQVRHRHPKLSLLQYRHNLLY
jgi:hypothetical protein